MRKFFSLIAAVLFAGSMMADNYVLVTDASTLAAGDQIIITNAVPDRAIGTTQNNNNRAAVAVTETDGVIVPGDDVQIITLVAADANFMLQVGEDAYLYAASNSSNHLKTSTAATAGDNGKFAITITEGVASVTAQGNNSRNDLRYNSNNGTFACYGSNTSVEAGLMIFKLDGEVTPPEPTAEYYLVGNFNGWQALEAYKLVVNPGNAEEMMISGVQLAADDSIKVLGIQGETTTWYPDNAANYVIAADGEYDIYFRADGQGGDDWYYHYFYVAEVVAPVISLYTCAQVQANEATEAGELNEVQVLFINGGQFYVRDASGMTLIYKSNHGLTVGDFVSGIVGTSTIYNNITPQFQPSNAPADWTIIAGDAPVYDEKTEAPVVTDINGVYNFKNVSFSEAVEFTTAAKGTAVTATIGEGTLVIFNNYKKAFSFEAEKAYDITGVVTIYQNNPQIYFISATEHVATAIDNTAVEGKAVKFFENGQLVIIKNGVRYNAQGTRL